MRAFLAAVLSVIAVGVMLIAYGLLTPRVPAAAGGAVAWPTDPRAIPVGDQIGIIDGNAYPYAARAPYAYQLTRPAMIPASDVRPIADDDYVAPRRPAASRVVAPAARTRTVERASGPTWQKTAMVIGGTTAAGAGLGAIFGGKKGALIGAAIGGGAGTLYEVKKRR
jgi:hypothetical protein